MTTIETNLKNLKIEMNGKYLTEESLGKILKALYPNRIWDHDKRFKPINSAMVYNFRPDYCCHDLKMCVEFDGPDHYTKANVIQADIKKDLTVQSLDYNIIRIPYFLQLKTDTIKYFFDIDVDFDYGFNHGFINKRVTLPANFCQQGIWKFKDFITSLDKSGSIFQEIKESLINKIENSKIPISIATLTVVPTDLMLPLGLLKFNHDSLKNQNLIKSNLKSNWNCVILESSQTILDQTGVYDLRYTYSANGNLSGYSFMMTYKNCCTNKFTLLVEKLNEDTITLFSYKDDILLLRKNFSIEDINLFNITDFILF